MLPSIHSASPAHLPWKAVSSALGVDKNDNKVPACREHALQLEGGRQVFEKTQNVKYVWEWWVSHDLQIPLYPHVLWAAPHLHLCLVGNTAWPENLWGHLTESILLQRPILCLPCTLIQPFNCLPWPLTPLLFLMSLYFVIHWRCHTQRRMCKVCRWFEHPSAWPWSLVYSTPPPGCAIDIRILSGPASTPSILTSSATIIFPYQKLLSTLVFQLLQ